MHQSHFIPACVSREAVLLEYYAVVKTIARRLARRLPAHIDRQELTQEGMIGLMDAQERYDPTLGVPFKAYAETRIRGAMVDWLRKQDVVPRSVRRKAHLIESGRAELVRTLERAPTREELAHHLGLSVEALDAIARTAGIRRTVSMDASTDEEGGVPLVERLSKADAVGQDAWMQDKQERRLTRSAIDHLPERERRAIRLHHIDGHTLRETGRLLGVTESRACQLTKKGIERLRFRLRDSVPPG
jgi:RNA polymerase sigma factor for flagellar operon FliA